MGRIYRVEELVTNINNLDLLEDVNRGYVAFKDELPFLLYVAGCDDYGKGLEKYKRPHFHIHQTVGFLINKIIIYIPTLEEWKINKKFDIFGNVNKKFEDITKILTEWFDKDWQNRNYCTNHEKIIKIWNNYNYYNKNVDKM